MNYYIIAGEASGDLHGSNLMRSLKERDPAASFRCWGGNLMLQAGGELVKHYRDLAFMGFWEVLIHLRDYVRLRGCSLCSFLFPAPSLEGPRRTQCYHRPLLVCPKPYMSHHVSQAFLE